MERRKRLSAFAGIGLAAGIVLAAATVFADEFTLRDGRTITGRIIAQSGAQYLIKTEDGKTIRVDIYKIKKMKGAPRPKAVKPAVTAPAASATPGGK